MKKFQEGLIDLLLIDRAEKENVLTWIEDKLDKFKEAPIEDIAVPCKINRTDYKNVPIFVRALNNTQAIDKTFQKRIGEKYYYIYVIPVKRDEEKAKDCKKRDVLAFDKDKKDHITLINYEMMMDRNVFNKVQVILDAMNWGDDFEQLRNKYIKPKIKRTKKVKENV